MKKILVIILILLSFTTLVFSNSANSIENPYKIAVDHNNNQYIADPLNNCIIKISNDGKTTVIKNNFNQPQAIAIDKHNNIYILDTGNHRLQKFSQTGNNIRYIKDININLKYPRDLAISDDNNYLYVLDSGNHNIKKINISNGKDLLEREFGNIENAYGIAVDPYDNIYVADTGTHTIKKYNSNGNLISIFGHQGHRKGELFLPFDIVVGHSGQIIVADAGNNRLQLLSANGNYLKILASNINLKNLRGIALNKNSGEILISTSDNSTKIKKIDIGYKIKSFSIENNYFSPNQDFIKDNLILTLDLIAATDIDIEVFKENQQIIKENLFNNIQGFQKIKWQPKNKKLKDGEYNFKIICKDSQSKKEPFIISDTFIIDNTSPKIEEWYVTPNIFSPNNDGINEKLILSAKANEKGILIADLFLKKEGKLHTQIKSHEKYNKKQEITWSGKNKFQETINGEYSYELFFEDKAGNRSREKKGTFTLNHIHPLINTVLVENKYHQPNEKFQLKYTLRQSSKVNISIKNLTGAIIKKIHQGKQQAGKHIITINLDKIASGEYTIEIFAKKNNLQDSFFQGIIIDGNPPQIAELAITKKEIWGGGIDTTLISFITNEDCSCNITLETQNKETITTLLAHETIEKELLYTFPFDGLYQNEQVIAPGEYFITIELADYLGNIAIKMIPITISANSPKIKNLEISSDVLSLHGTGFFKSIEFKYDLQDSIGDLFLTLQIFKEGELVENIADDQRRIRGYNYDYWYANSELTDGIYNYILNVRDEYGHFDTKRGTLYVIADRPIIKGFLQSYNAISPANLDNINDELSLSFTSIISNSLILKTIQDDNPSDNIEAADSLIVKFVVGDTELEKNSFYGTNQYIWKGQDDKNEYLADNTYEYSLYIIDATGAESDRVTGSIIVANSNNIVNTNNIEVAINNTSTNYQNEIYNPYSQYQQVTINFELKQSQFNQTIAITILDKNNNIFNKDYIPYTGAGNYTYGWDGKNNNNQYANDGQYTLQLHLEDEIGNDFYFESETFWLQDEKIISIGNNNDYANVSINGSTIEVSWISGYDNITQNINDSNSAPPGNSASAAINFYLTHYQYIAINTFLSGNISTSSQTGATTGWMGPGNIASTLNWTSNIASLTNTTGTISTNYVNRTYHYKKTSSVSAGKIWTAINSYDSPSIPNQPAIAPDEPPTINLINSIYHSVSKQGQNIIYQRSNNCSNWSKPIIINSNNPANIGKVGVFPAINNDFVYITWSDDRNGNKNIFFQPLAIAFAPLAGDTYNNYRVSSLQTKIYTTAITPLEITTHTNSIDSIPYIIYPKSAEIVAETKPILVWQSPTWAVHTSTNYEIYISPDNNNFSEADDFSFALSPAQLSFTNTDNRIVSYKIPNSYELESGPYYWQIAAKDSISDPIRATSNIENFVIQEQLSIKNQINYPNPFKRTTTIRYQLSQDAETHVNIFTITGKLVRHMKFYKGFEGGKGSTYFDKYNDILWDGKNDVGNEVVNGVYIYKIKATNNSKTTKAKGKMIKWK